MSAQQGRGRGDGRGRGRQLAVGRGRGGFGDAGSRGSSRGGERGGFPRGERGGGERGRGGFGEGQRGGGGTFRGFRGGGGRGGGRGGASVQVYSTPDDSVPAPDSVVKNTEDVIQESAGTVYKSLKAGDLEFPPRPGYGTRGTPVILWANYVQLLPSPKLVLYRYSVDVVPDSDGKKPTGKKLCQIIRLLLGAPEFSPFRSDIVTDFMSTLISRQELDAQDRVIEIQYREELEDSPPAVRAKSYQVCVKFTNVLRVSELINYLTSTNIGEAYADKLPITQALNVFLNHYSKSADNLATIGASKSFSVGSNSDKWDLGAGLTAIRGFFSSVRLATCRVLVNVNVSHGAFYNDDGLDQLIQKYQYANGPDNNKLKKFLKGLKVRTTHLREKTNAAGQVIPKFKTIIALAEKSDGRSLQKPPRVKHDGAGPKDVEFWLDEQPHSPSASTSSSAGKEGRKGKKGGPRAGPAAPGRYISVWDFFANTHGIRISDPRIPVVNVGTAQRPSYLPAQVCKVKPGQPYGQGASGKQNSLSPNQTAQMIRFAVRRPWENADSIIHQGFETVDLGGANTLLASYGIQSPQKLITVQGRVLDRPKVVYRGNKVAEVQSGSWNMLKVQFNTPGTRLKRWSYLKINTPDFRDAFPDEQRLAAAMSELHMALGATGMLGDKPVPGRSLSCSDRDMNDPRLVETLQQAATRFDLLFIVLPDPNHPLYTQIKRLGDVKYGILTICCNGVKLANERGRDQYLKNLALKFNLKLGGTNQVVDNLRRSIIDEDRTMVVGIDVTHPSPGSSEDAPSIAGMVSSIDKTLGQWPATLRIQSKARKEEVDNLGEMLKRHLGLWLSKGKHKSYPENILIYRDGVSEGQYHKVLDEELPLLRQACKEAYPAVDQKNGLPRLTIMIVGKRHHTRFYPTSVSTADRFSNPQPGTVVDRGVTEATNWDFFLQPHAALQGTARPAHYFMVLDEVFKHRYKTIPAPHRNLADVVEELTHGMSYTFGRATKAVSVCPPAKYADMVCERARCYVNSLYEPSKHAQSSSRGSQGGASACNDDVLVHERLRDTMFYI